MKKKDFVKFQQINNFKKINRLSSTNQIQNLKVFTLHVCFSKLIMNISRQEVSILWNFSKTIRRNTSNTY